jgi:uncharacterized protein (DUF1697 family)
MKYLALLRGVNVGGNSIIKMVDLKKAVEKAGFTGVQTYINSGNVIFESVEKDAAKIAQALEETLRKTFNIDSRVAVLTPAQLKNVIAGVPDEWKTPGDIRCYVAFLLPPVSAEEVIGEIKLKEGVDFVKPGLGVVYMTTLLGGITKSGFTKIIGKPVYKEITMRNYNTVKKLQELMEP